MVLKLIGGVLDVLFMRWLLGSHLSIMKIGWNYFKILFMLNLMSQWYLFIIIVMQFSPKLQDLIKKLLHKDPNKRLGTNGAK